MRSSNSHLLSTNKANSRKIRAAADTRNSTITVTLVFYRGVAVWGRCFLPPLHVQLHAQSLSLDNIKHVNPVRYPTPVEPAVSLQIIEQGYVEPWRLAGGIYPFSRHQLYLQPTTGFILCHLNIILSLIFLIVNKCKCNAACYIVSYCDQMPLNSSHILQLMRAGCSYTYPPIVYGFVF